jgi:hypothetical protein
MTSTTVTAVTVAAVAAGIAGCGPHTPHKPASNPASSAHATPSANRFPPLPPDVNAGTLVPGPVSSLRPGMSIMVGDKTTTVCTAGFYLDYPDPNHPGRRIPGFVTAAQCAAGNGHAPVAVMQAEAAGQPPKRTQIGQVTYLPAGDERPAVTGEPWTNPISPLAVFSSGQPNWALPVGTMVNGADPSSQLVQTAQQAEQRQAAAKWTNSFGVVVSGRVLDPAATPELQDLPAGIERVVVAADDPAQPVYPEVLGSAVTADVDGGTANLGTIVGTDETRHWVVVDLIAPFLAQRGAQLLTTR